MSILIEYVAVYAPWIYALCGIAALYQIYRLWNVRAERRQAVFSLERAKATQEIQSIFSIALLLLVTMGGTYFISTTLATAVEPTITAVISATPVGQVLLPTPTNTPAIVAPPAPLSAPTPAIIVVATVTPVATPTPAPPTPTAAPAVVSANCPNPQAIITSPGNNAVLRGLSAVLGTASHDQFQYYKIEYAQSGTEGWTYLGGGNSPVVDGGLLTFDSHNLANGSWLLRLVVVDQTGNFPDPCQVAVQVQN